MAKVDKISRKPALVGYISLLSIFLTVAYFFNGPTIEHRPQKEGRYPSANTSKRPRI